MIAVKDHMQNSKVLTVGYTVREPEVIVEAETEETTVDQGDNGRLHEPEKLFGYRVGYLPILTWYSRMPPTEWWLLQKKEPYRTTYS